MTQTARLALPLLVPGMAAKEVVHNEALGILAALVQPVMRSGPVTNPDPAANIGDIVIVAPGATGDFAGQEGALALLGDNGWTFVAPFTGLTARMASDGRSWRYDGTDWLEGVEEVSSIHVSGTKVVGAQQPDIADPSGGGSADTKARTAISAILDALRSHGLIAGAQ